MNKNNSELSTVVVTSAYGASKRSKKGNASAKQLAEKVTGIQIEPSGLQPVGGHQKFEQYIKDSAVAVFDEDNEPTTGEVTLSFRVNEEGHPEILKLHNPPAKRVKKKPSGF